MKAISRLFLLMILIAFSCNSDPEKNKHRKFNVGKQEWVSPSSTNKFNEINYTATEVPLSYYILKEAEESDVDEVDSIAEANKLERIIEFEFVEDNGKELLGEEFTKMDYTESLEYISFNIQNDFYLVTSKSDTIRCSGVIVERSYKVAPQQKILLFFTGVEPDEHVQLVYNDQLFGKGIMKFKMNDNSTKLLL